MEGEEREMKKEERETKGKQGEERDREERAVEGERDGGRDQKKRERKTRGERAKSEKRSGRRDWEDLQQTKINLPLKHTVSLYNYTFSLISLIVAIHILPLQDTSTNPTPSLKPPTKLLAEVSPSIDTIAP